MDCKKRQRKKERGAGIFWFPVLKMQMSIKQIFFLLCFVSRKKEVTKKSPFPFPPPPLSPCDKWAHTPSPRGREAVAADMSESAEWKRMKEGGGKINFPLIV